MKTLRLCLVVTDRIDTRQLVSQVVRASDGAVATFHGCVRDHHHGRVVNHLEYHAYPEMAAEELERIATELIETHDLGGIALVHRIGTLQIGETAVMVAAAAPHRADALAACAAGIEAIKSRLPVWKKEFFADGGEPEWVFGPDEICVTAPAAAEGEKTGA